MRRFFRITLIGILVAACVLAVSAVVTFFGVRAIERAHSPTGGFVEVGGGRLHVVELGQTERPDDPPVLLIHGASANLEDMRMALGERLAAHHRVILVDRPGLGWSERSDPYGNAPARQAAMLSEMLERLDVGSAIVVGHSLGGAVAAAMALDDPSRVAGLLLLSPVLYPQDGGVSTYNRLAAMPVIGPLAVWTMAMPAATVLIGPKLKQVFSPQAVPADYVERAAIRLVLRPQAFIANAQDIVGLKGYLAAQSRRYPGIKVPTIVMTGDQDKTISRWLHSRAFIDAVPQAKLVELEGIGHMPHHVAAEAVVGAIEELAAKAER
jgi:pimeloyl-ACP methyl ester carboxylesterase